MAEMVRKILYRRSILFFDYLTFEYGTESLTRNAGHCFVTSLNSADLFVTFHHLPYVHLDNYSGSLRPMVKVPVTESKAQSWDKGLALHSVEPGARRGGWSAPRPGRFTPGKDPVLIVQGAGWGQGPVWAYAKNLAPTRFRSSDGLARSQSLYRLSYPREHKVLYMSNGKKSEGTSNVTLQHVVKCSSRYEIFTSKRGMFSTWT
jgi:hypothetical protein